MVFSKTKARESILREFRDSVLSGFPDGRKFINQVLVPLSDAYEIVTRADYKATAGADEINKLLSWLNRLDNNDWIPPAIKFFSRSESNATSLNRFLTDLERLAASMLVRRVDITRRIERYGRVLLDIEAEKDLYAEVSPLQLTPAEQQETIARLGGEIYTVTRVRLYLLLRLDSALSSGGASYEHPLITVEHVLPQSPTADSQWALRFNEEQRGYWVHRLANLVLLTQRKNSEASNFEFGVKKEKYFTTASGVSPFALTTQVLHQTEWTPELLEQRQGDCISILAHLWRLKAALPGEDVLVEKD